MPAIASPTPSPRTTRTRAEFIARVRSDLGLTGSSLLGTDEIGDWLIEAQERFAVETHWFRAGHNMGVTDGTAEYDLPSTASYRCLMIEEVWHNDLPLYASTREKVASGSPNWRTQEGTPFCYFLRGNSSVYLYPTPGTTDADALDLYFAALPPKVTAAGDQYYLPHGFEDYLLNYACWRASVKDAHGEGARRVEMYLGLWMKDLERGKQKVQEADNQEVVSMGEEAVYGRQAGGGFIPYFTNITAP